MAIDYDTFIKCWLPDKSLLLEQMIIDDLFEVAQSIHNAELESLRQELARKEEALRKIVYMCDVDACAMVSCCQGAYAITAQAALAPQADKEGE